jgi:hypothetical protein
MFGVVLIGLARAAAGADPEASAEPGADAPEAPVEAPPPAPPEPPAADPAEAVGSFETVLREAKQRYFQGDVAGARDLLGGLQARVQAGEDPPWDLVVDALTYFGEIAYEAGDKDQASATFRLLLERDLQTPISPYHHPLEVVSWFEVVRNLVRSERELENVVPPPVPFEPPPAPIWTFAPFGIPQLAQGRTAAGAVYGGLQAGFGIASLALFGSLRYVNDDPDRSGRDWAPGQVPQQVQLRRYLLQWPVTIGFYATWGISAIDAARWHQNHAAPRVSVVPGRTPQVVLSGAF